jgi:hypothetical protein
MSCTAATDDEQQNVAVYDDDELPRWPLPLRLMIPRQWQAANLLQQSVHLLSCINNREINLSRRIKN